MKICLVELFLVVLFGCFFLTSCTISLQNVSSNGRSEDQLDTAQTASPDIKSDLSIPLKPL